MDLEIEESKGSTHVGRTTKNDNYETPPELFQKLNEFFDFEVDLAASPENALCDNFCSEAESFLGEHGIYAAGMRAWLNPPFSMKEAFLSRAVELRNKFPLIVCIVPNNARETEWWASMGVASRR